MSATPALSQHKLLTWENPAESAKVFGAIIVSLIVLKYFSIASTLFFLASVALGGSAIAEYAGKTLTGTGFVTKYKPAYSSVISQNADCIGSGISKNLKKFETEIQDLFFSRNIETTFRACGLTYVLYKLTSWFSIYSLIFISTVLAFTGPVVYLKNQKQIDETIERLTKLIKDKVVEYTKLAQDKASPILEQASSKLGPVGDLIKSKLPVRTAGSTVETEKKNDITPVQAETVDPTFPDVPTAEIQSKIATGSESVSTGIAESTN